MKKEKEVHRLLFRGVCDRVWVAPQNKTTARIKVGMCKKGGKHIDYCSGLGEGR